MVKLKMRKNFLLARWAYGDKKPNRLPGPESEMQYNSSAKRWIHTDSALTHGHVVYSVKFLGHVEVDYPKGLDVVQKSIKKLEFQGHLKRSQGEKAKVADLAISIDGIAIRDQKEKQTMHEFPLHLISYCADDKAERRHLSFIAKKESGCSRHECYVFVSNKLTEDITLTIGQAFDLAYRKFLESTGNDIDIKRDLIHARRRISELEKRVGDLERQLNERESVFVIPELTECMSPRHETQYTM